MSASRGDGKSEPADYLMTLPQVGEMIGGRSEKTVRRLMDRGILPRAVRVNRSLMLWASEVRQYLERLRVTQTEGCV